jgi:hypothetical protein
MDGGGDVGVAFQAYRRKPSEDNTEPSKKPLGADG